VRNVGLKDTFDPRPPVRALFASKSIMIRMRLLLATHEKVMFSPTYIKRWCFLWQKSLSN